MWKNKNVWIILMGEFIAGIGLWLGIIGNLEFMQRHIPSDFKKSLIMFAGLLAGVMVGPLAGRLIDQASKKKILLYAGFGRVVSVVFMFLALHFDNVWYMVFFMVAIQISAAFYFPALQAVIPLVVRDQDLLQMNGMHMNVATIARIAGTSIGGVLLVVLSLEYMYGFSMLAYALLFASTYLLEFQDTPVQPSKNATNQKAGFTEVFRILKEVPVAFNTLVLNIIPLLFIGGFNLMVINISEMQKDPAIKGLLYTVEGVAFMLGAFFVKYASKRTSPQRLMYTYSFIIAFAHLSLFFSNIKWMSLVSFTIFGLGVGGFFPVASTVFQTKIAKTYHGRLFSFRNMFERVMFQVVLLATGLFLDTIGLQYMVLIFGLVSLLILFLLLSRPKAMSLETKESQSS
ncbi:MFS transporter [Ectobacillus antri]|jgi:MFS family permease|uniref:MFS transporter n=1 Tax=Ectobacillus antri TaxID=2486280 RepID=A0ABT6H437_9BACI|nr:MFS transporter [Ectobacillus antri]MDG4657010.1 MFS transporter [Ectobacillus antri]MDG5754112.1 MFS transporter [Ectobacillus antri]